MSSEPATHEDESIEQIIRQLAGRVAELEAENEKLRNQLQEVE
jgi:hypothetical protein